MITVEKTEKHNRTLLFKNINPMFRTDPSELEVALCYTEEPNEGNRCGKAITLDNHVIPAIHAAFECARQLEALTTQLYDANLLIPPAVEKALKAMKGGAQ